MSVIERAEKRLQEEIRQNDLGADNRRLLAYWAAYLDGARAQRDEAEAQLPKRGKWVEDTTTYAGPGLSNYKCSLCGKICGTWRRGLKPSELPNWCGNCGADMRARMEVQE